MAIMQTSDRQQAFRDLVAEIVKRGQVFNLSKSDTQAAIDAVDQWVSDNATSYNTALPVAARNTLTSAEKAAVLMIVLGRRYKVGA